MAKMKKCATCGADIASSAKACPKCGAKNKKPIFLRGWFVLLVIIVVGVIGINLVSASNNYKITVYDELGPLEQLKASELSKIADTDGTSFNNDYYGKKVEFVAKIQKTAENITYANVGKSYETALTFGYYLTAGSQEPLNFATGDKVKVIGVISGSRSTDVYVDITSVQAVG